MPEAALETGQFLFDTTQQRTYNTTMATAIVSFAVIALTTAGYFNYRDYRKARAKRTNKE